MPDAAAILQATARVLPISAGSLPHYCHVDLAKPLAGAGFFVRQLHHRPGKVETSRLCRVVPCVCKLVHHVCRLVQRVCKLVHSVRSVVQP